MAVSEAEIDVAQLQQLLAEHPDELRKLLSDVDSMLYDKYGRSLRVTDKVITPAGEPGMIIRLDKKSKRVLIQLDDEARTRMIMAHRVEVRRGRPRKKTLRIA